MAKLSKTGKSVKATIYLPATIQRIIGKTGEGELSGRIADIVDRYGEIIKRADKELGLMLTDREIHVVNAAIRETIWNPASMIDGGIVTDLEDAESTYFENEDERAAIISKVKALPYDQLVAIVERVRRFMRQQEKD